MHVSNIVSVVKIRFASNVVRRNVNTKNTWRNRDTVNRVKWDQ